jgi:hypothetical protein
VRYKKVFKNAFFALTFLLTILNAGFYFAETLSGEPLYAKALKVVGFCPAGQTTIVGDTGATGDTGAKGDTGAIGDTGAKGDIGGVGDTGVKGDTGAVGETGAIGECQAQMNLTNLAADLVPSKDNFFSLGTAKFRWKDVQVGPGTIYLEDKETGLQVGLTVSAGTLLLDRVENLRLGNIRITKDGIESLIAGQDIRIGNINDRGYLSVANGIKFPDGSIFTTKPSNGVNGSDGANGGGGATGPAGAAGVTGASGATGPAGASGTNGSIGPIGPIGPQGPQGPAGSGIPDGYIEQPFCADERTQVITLGECRDSGIKLIWLMRKN